MKIFSVVINKGGVGKTSLVTNLASALSLQKPDKKILILDTDGQGNCAIAFGHNPNKLKETLYSSLVQNTSPKKAIIHLRDNLDLLPSNDEMNYLEFDVLTNLKDYPDPFVLLKRIVDQIKDDYDYIFIDSPPSMGLVAGNILTVSDQVFIPFVPETFSVQGLIRVIQTIEDFQQERKVKAKIGGVIGMMIDTRTSLHNGLLIQADAYCKKIDIRMLKTRIPRTVRFASATAQFNMPAVLVDKNSQAVKVYFDLLEEVIQE